MKQISEKIKQLRKLMKEKGIDVYYIPNGDDHISDEYTASYFQCMSYISEFSGHSGSVVVTPTFAGLWTDGRYFTQAEGELKNTGITLMRMGQAGVPTVKEFLIEQVPMNGCIGFDARVVPIQFTSDLERATKSKRVSFFLKYDLVGEIWKDREPLPQEKVFLLPKKYTGEDAKERIQRVRTLMKQEKVDALLLTQLEDPCWLLNVRGDDIPCTPVVYAYCLVTMRSITYYVDLKKVTPVVKEELKKAKVKLSAYENIYQDIKALKKQTLWVDLNRLNTALYQSIDASNQIKHGVSPILKMRAIKNQTEIKHIRESHIKDGVAMVKFLYWLKENIGKIQMSEISAENYLYALREQQDAYLEPSFPTISAYKGHAAMMHYSATLKSNANLKKEGFLLVDSGGTYLGGTTDITRTIALGKLTAQEKYYFTKVVSSNLRLTRAKFLQGTTGQNLDILARGVIWDMDIDYQCGTGHGVGHVLSVHEGPHGIRWGMPKDREPAILEPGMIVTNEPGIYVPHQLGIRIENELLVVKGKKNFYGQFLAFECITYCPIDLDAIDPKYLTVDDIEDLNDYHQMVYEKLSPYLNAKEKKWLKKATRRI